jgi:glycosyltransferase involved in cell wall biosynthesis
MPLRLAVLADFREEGWPSMDRCADMLAAHLPAERVTPRFIRSFSHFPGRIAFNVDRLLNRFVTYPHFAGRLARRFDAFHIADHTYAHLVHAMPADRTGVYCHDIDAFRCLVDPAADPRPRWFRALARRILTGMQKAAVVFHNSTATRDDLLRFGLIDLSRLASAPLGVSPEFRAKPGEPVPWLEPLVGRPWVLHVGSCIPRKRIDVLLATVAAARKAVPGLVLVKVGGEWTPQQRVEIAYLGLDVIHIPRASDAELAESYRRAGAVLVPSSAEGFGLPVLEGLACGAAVVASDIPSLREAGGPAAVYVPIGDVPAWSAAVTRVLTDPEFAPPRAERLVWATRFSWEQHAATVAAAYQAVLHSPRGASPAAKTDSFP